MTNCQLLTAACVADLTQCQWMRLQGRVIKSRAHRRMNRFCRESEQAFTQIESCERQSAFQVNQCCPSAVWLGLTTAAVALCFRGPWMTAKPSNPTLWRARTQNQRGPHSCLGGQGTAGIRTRDFRGHVRHWRISDAGSRDTGLMPAGVLRPILFILGPPIRAATFAPIVRRAKCPAALF